MTRGAERAASTRHAERRTSVRSTVPGAGGARSAQAFLGQAREGSARTSDGLISLPAHAGIRAAAWVSLLDRASGNP
jgi:hypothetical protein